MKIIPYSSKLLLDDQIKKFIINIILNEYNQPKVIRNDLDNLEFYSEKSNKLFLLINNNKVFGTIGVITIGNKAIIKRFYIEKNTRDKGFGNLLYNKVLSYIKKNNIKHVCLNCDTKKMEKAYQFYLNKGFSILKIRKDGYAVMRLKL